VQPAITDRYWFEYSKSLLDTAIARREAAAETLQKLVVWLWAIYTGAAAAGFALSGKQLDFWPTALIALPSGLLVLVYWAAVWVQMPRIVAFDPRSPTEIEAAYSEILLAKNQRLLVTLLLSVVTATMVSSGLLVASVSRAPRFIEPLFRAAIQRVKDGPVVSVTAYVGRVANIELSAMPVVGSAPVLDQAVRAVLIPSEEGLIQTRPLRKTAEVGPNVSGEPLSSSPITGIADCAAPANGRSITAAPARKTRRSPRFIRSPRRRARRRGPGDHRRAGKLRQLATPDHVERKQHQPPSAAASPPHVPRPRCRQPPARRAGAVGTATRCPHGSSGLRTAQSVRRQTPDGRRAIGAARMLVGALGTQLVVPGSVSCGAPQVAEAGATFWFMRKRFLGSYFALSLARRS
jgi:hypothetical protein